MNRCREPSFLSFTIRARGIQRLLRNHRLPGWSLGQLQPLIFYLWNLLSEKKANQKWKETDFQCQRMGKRFLPVRLPPRAFRAVLVCAYAALHDVLSYAMTYSHKPHSFLYFHLILLFLFLNVISVSLL